MDFNLKNDKLKVSISKLPFSYIAELTLWTEASLYSTVLVLYSTTPLTF